MVYECVRCGNDGQLRSSRRPGNSLAEYEAMQKRLRDSFLKSCPELCPSCLAELVEWVTSKRQEHQERIRLRYGR